MLELDFKNKRRKHTSKFSGTIINFYNLAEVFADLIIYKNKEQRCIWGKKSYTWAESDLLGKKLNLQWISGCYLCPFFTLILKECATSVGLVDLN